MRKTLLFVGPVLTASGYGVHARQLLRFLLSASDAYDVFVRPIRWGETPFLYGEFPEIEEACGREHPPKFDISVQVTIPNEFQRLAHLNIGVTAGIETDRVTPAWLQKCNENIDLLVVPSIHSRDAFTVAYQGSDGSQLRLQRPMIVCPEGVDTSVFRPVGGEETVTEAWALQGLELAPRNLLFVGLGLDKPDGRDRKNVTRLVAWFCKEFKGRQDVGLILKTSIVNGSLVDLELTKKRVTEIKRSVVGEERYPAVHIVHGRLGDDELRAMYVSARVTAMVSLTHGEGYGLPLIEAAACDLPVIATGWSGHLDFLTKDGRDLFVRVEHDLKEIPQECLWEGVMEPGCRWADPREDDACRKMAMVLQEPPQEWATELGVHVRENYSLERVGEFFLRVMSEAVQQFGQSRPASREELVTSVRERLAIDGSRPTLIYTMPMSAGDVYLSTGVVSALRKKYPGHRIFFATGRPYFDILVGNTDIDDVVDWQPWMQDVSVLEEIFGTAFTPNIGIQMQGANWVRGGKGRNIIEEMAQHCDVPAVECTPRIEYEKCDGFGQDGNGIALAEFIAVHTGGQKSARAWRWWPDLVKNLRRVGLRVVQVGAQDDLDCGPVDLDLRGKTNFRQLASVVSQAATFVGIDSLPMHLATTAMPCVKTVAIFGSSYPQNTGPYKEGLVRKMMDKKRLHLIETTDRKGCDRACYKDECKVDRDDPCLNNIPPAEVFQAVGDCLLRELGPYVEPPIRLSGYIHILNPIRNGYPYIDAVYSMMGFCDEVVVVDGGSEDGSVETMRTELERRLGLGYPEAVNPHCELRVEVREWDPEEPGMDGMQKAFGRAMCSPDTDFLWQQDADEVVHPRDFGKIRELCRRFPAGARLMHLPVVELWGDDRTCRTDRHAWKWRLSRNDFHITHGINAQARVMDQRTGRTLSRPGMSDGCEYIDVVSGEHLPHIGFWNQGLEELRRRDPEEYGRQMNAVFDRLPSVWHYSWEDLPRKVRNFRDFWDRQWATLYGETEPRPRFPDVVTEEDVVSKAEELRKRGGEHGPASTFKITLEAPNVR